MSPLAEAEAEAEAEGGEWEKGGGKFKPLPFSKITKN